MKRFLLNALSVGFCFVTSATWAATLTVTTTADTGIGSLRQAIADASPGDTISFDPSLAGQTIGLTTIGDSTYGPSALLIDKEITIAGLSGNSGVIIARTGATPMRLFYINASGSLTLRNLTLSNGTAKGGDGGGPNGNNSEGGGGGAAGLGGAIYNQGALAIDQTTLSGNAAQGGMGGNGSGNISSVGGGGGGLSGDGLQGSSGGTGGANGGGNGGTTTSGGQNGLFGGGGGGGNFSGCGRSGGNGGFGGGGGGGGGAACGTNFGTGGFAGGNGGQGDGGNGGSGGGGGGALGGAIFNHNGSVSITNSTLSGNSAIGGDGGAALNTGNGGDGGGGIGGAVFNLNGAVTVTNSTVANNTAQGGIAGAANTGTAGSAGAGGAGGIYNLAHETATGVVEADADLTLNNAIVSGSITASEDVVNNQRASTATATATMPNIVQTPIVNMSGTVNDTGVSSVDPMLGPLSNNGGPTFTHALLAGSPAIDAGNNCVFDNSCSPALGFSLITDQRGKARKVDGDFNGTPTVDLGAYELDPPQTGPFVVNTADETDDGACTSFHCSLREAINAANVDADASTINFAIPGSGVHTITLGSALPEVTQPVTINGYSQSGASANTLAVGSDAVLLIEINGAGSGGFGLTVSASNSTIRGLVINRSTGSEIVLQFGTNQTVGGCFLGTDPSGASDFGVTTRSGVEINGNNGNTIGGPNPADRNVISGGDSAGIFIINSASNNTVQNNYIGTDKSGTTDLGNADMGVLIENRTNNTIKGNLISGNDGDGVQIRGPSVPAVANKILGNLIGTKANGTDALGNGGAGVELKSDATNNVIGGTGPGDGNIIAFNGGDGVSLNSGVDTSVRGNSIFSNTGVGIDLAPDGVTANDAGDADTGVNNLQNFPIIRAALIGGPNTIRGTLNSTPGQTFTIDLYSSPSCDASGNGEGMTYLGSTTTSTTNANGDAMFSFGSGSVSAGDFVTATATDSTGNTSEFSACFQATTFAPGTIGFAQANTDDTETNSSTHTVDIVVTRTGGSDGAVSVGYSVTDGIATTADNDYSASPVSGTLNWPNGDSANRTITITVKGDTKFEPDETVNITLSSATGGATIGTNPATLTIKNDDPQPSISINNVTQNEGDAATSNFDFLVSLSNPSSEIITVKYATADDSATAGSDYTAVTPTLLTFNPGVTSQPARVVVNGDTTVESNEQFFVNLSDVSSTATIADGQGVGTITNDDTDVSVAVSPSPVAENSGTDMVYTFTRNGVTTGSLTVNFTIGGHATFTSDYSQMGATSFTPPNGTVTFTGPTSTVTIHPEPDTTPEPDETVILTVTSGTGYTVGSPSSATGTITNDDGPPAIVYVDDSWAGTTTGDDPDMGGPATYFGFDAFATIADGVAAVKDGGTVIVYAGSYPGDVNVNKSVMLTGPQAGVNPDDVNWNDVRTNLANEAVIQGALNLGIQNTITVDGFTVNRSASNEGHILIGASLVGTHPTTQLTIQNNRITGTRSTGTAWAGIHSNFLDTPGGPFSYPGANATITHNRIAIGGSASGSGILINRLLPGTDTNSSLAITDNYVASDYVASTPDTGSAILIIQTEASAVGGVQVTGNHLPAGEIALFRTLGGNIANNQMITPAFHGVWLEGGDDSITVTGNTITNPKREAIVVEDAGVSAPTARPNSNITVSNNTVTVDATMLDASVTTESLFDIGGGLTGTNVISDNTLTITGALPGGVTAVYGVGVHNRNISAPSDPQTVGAVSLTGNTFTGGGSLSGNSAGVKLDVNLTVTTQVSLDGANSISGFPYGVDAANGTVTMTSNTIVSNGTGVRFSNDATGEAHFNRIVGNTMGMSNSTATPIDAENNWWGCNFGPGQAGCDTVTAGAFFFRPWIVLRVSASPNPITPGATSTVTADMTHNVNNDPPSTDFVPPVVVTFASDAEGMVSSPPPPWTIINGQATTTFTSTSANNATVTATVDNQMEPVTIIVNKPTFSINDVSQAETNAGTTFTFTVTKTGTTAFETKVDYATGDGTAKVADNDYVSAMGTLTFGPNETMMPIMVTVNGDSMYEADETFFVNLMDHPTGGATVSPSQGQGTGTILNDDDEVSIAVAPDKVPENSGTDMVYTFTRIGPTGGSLTVNFTIGGDATFTSDYTQTGAATFAPPNGTVTFTAGSPTTTVTIHPQPDSDIEGDETVVLTVTSGTGYSAGTANSASGEITNDDTDVSVAVAPASVVENSGTDLVYTFKRDPKTSGDITVNFSVTGTADTTDYSVTSDPDVTFDTGTKTGTVKIHNLATEATVKIHPTDDNVAELGPDETVIVTVTAGSGYNVGSPNPATGKIVDNDTAVTVSVSPSSVREDSHASMDYTFTRTPANGPKTIAFSVGGTAKFNSDNAHPDLPDYTVTGATTFGPTSGTVTFADGIDTATVTVVPGNDNIYEPAETVILTVGSDVDYSAASPATGTATGTITPDDDPKPNLSVGDTTAPEGNGSGTTTFTFTVTRQGPAEVTTTVNWATSDGSTSPATGGASCGGAIDYKTASGTVTFAPNVTSQTFTVDVCQDTIVEPNETFLVTLSGAVEGAIVRAEGRGTIQNDDDPGTVFTVNTTDDVDDGVCEALPGGNCSLREAINSANLSLTPPALIKFDIPAADGRHFYYKDDHVAGQVTLANVATTTMANDTAIADIDPDWPHSWWSIKPLSALPALTQKITINGYSQNGTSANTLTASDNAVLRIELDGESAGAGTIGLTLSATDSTVKGLVINRFTSHGLSTSGGNANLSGNFIGTDVSGTLALANSGNGIAFSGHDAFIGGSTPADANLVSGNVSDGIALSNSNSNLILGNYIGAAANGTTALGNGGNGISFSGGGSAGNTVGGTESADRNVIAFNGGDGVQVAAGVGNGIRGNSIFSNGTTASNLGIDLGPDGVTANDPQDTDSGPNGLQNFPVINSALVTGSTRTIKGTLNSTPSTPASMPPILYTFQIDFYVSDTCSASGEGKTYLGSLLTDPTDANGNVNFTFHPDATHAPFMTANGSKAITATATGTSLSDTSEFSACVTVLNGAVDAGGAGTIEFASTTYTVDENANPAKAVITVRRAGGSNGAITATFSTSNGSATAGSDYTATTQLISFAEGDTTDQTVEIPITDDSIYEGNETVNLNLTNTQITLPNGIATALDQPDANQSAVLTIVENEPPVTLAINNVTHDEGDGDSVAYTFTVTKTGSTTVNTTVNYATANGTATAPDDFTAKNGTLTFLPGQTTKQITVDVNGDVTNEADETFTVHLSNPFNATISTADGTGTIVNDDAKPTFTIEDVSVPENGTAPNNATITVTKNGGTAFTTTVHYATSDGTATAGQDYTAVSDDLTFAPDEATKVITVPITDDSVFEGNETFTVTLSAPTNATLGSQSTATVTITENDPAPTVQFSSGNFNVGEAGGTRTITVTKVGSTAVPATVHYATGNGSAAAPGDYTATSGDLTFAPGDTSKQFTVAITNDTVFEGTETFNVTLSAPGNAALGSPSTATVTIQDDDPQPTPTATPTATATATATPTATPTAAPVQNLNISTRLRVDTGDNVMIAGFIVQGNVSKQVLLRGMGPSLAAFGISDLLLDPVLELRNSNSSLLTNDNWKDSPQRAQFEGTPFQPTDDRESVVVATLPAANYTAILTGKDNTVGVGIVEVYDRNPAADAQLGNISTRGFVRDGNDVMIGGFILGGNQMNARVALRGIGPSLSQFGLSNVLADPTLELHNADGTTLVANDDWTDDPASAALLTANGLGLSNNKESGIFTTLPAGQFTAILAGKNGGVGIGLVEIYNLK